MSKLSKSILDAIHTKKIIPRSKWYFIGVHVMLWACFILTLVIGIFSVGFMLLEFNMPERLYMEWMENSHEINFLAYLPYVWALGSLLCLGIGYFVFSKTERGYRVSTVWMISLLIVGSLTGGFILYQAKLIEGSEDRMRHFIPPYERMRAQLHRGMPLPEFGMLPGEIESIEDNTYTVKSPDNSLWKVSLNCAEDPCKNKQKNLTKNEPMIFIGSIQGDRDDKVFTATNIRTPPHNKRGKGIIIKLLPPNTEKN